MSDGAATIFARASGAGVAAVAVLRLSGPQSSRVLEALAGTLPPARHASLRRLRAPGTDEVLDHALVLWFPGPHSYTGEDAAELHLHGGAAVLDGVAEALTTLAPLLRGKSLVMLFSDLLTDAEGTIKALYRLRHAGHEVILFHILDEAEVHFPFTGLTEFEDVESDAKLEGPAEGMRDDYLSALGDYRAMWKKECGAAGVDFVPMDTSIGFDKALLEYLIQRQRRFAQNVRAIGGRMMPKVIVFAGINGSGKSSSAADGLLRIHDVRAFVNADTIARGLGAYEVERWAAKDAISLRKRLLRQKPVDFVRRSVDQRRARAESDETWQRFVRSAEHD